MQNIPTYEDMLVPKRKLASCTMSLLLCENNQLFFFYQKKMTSYDKKHKQANTIQLFRRKPLTRIVESLINTSLALAVILLIM